LTPKQYPFNLLAVNWAWNKNNLIKYFIRRIKRILVTIQFLNPDNTSFSENKEKLKHYINFDQVLKIKKTDSFFFFKSLGFDEKCFCELMQKQLIALQSKISSYFLWFFDENYDSFLSSVYCTLWCWNEDLMSNTENI